MNILTFSGFIPEQICDTKRFIRWNGVPVTSHYCGYAADFVSQVLTDPAIDGAAFPRTCDSSRVMVSYLDDCGKFVYQMHVPPRRDSVAAGFLASDIRRYQQAVERHYGVTISDIPQRCLLVNARDRKIAALYQELSGISYGAYLSMLHQMLQMPLYEQVVSDELPGKPCQGKRVFLIGPFLSQTALAAAIERAGLSIVGDRLPESKRLFSAPEVPAYGDIYENIARSILGKCVSPTQDRFNEILKEDLLEIRGKQVQGVIFVAQKFCEPYDYLFPSYKRMLDEQGIPVLRLTLSGSTDDRSFDAVLEAFADML